MIVLSEILKWSIERPVWQQDALRRLVQKGELSSDDIASLGEICKSKHGLSDEYFSEPLTHQHIAVPIAESAVSLISLDHIQGVNALASGQGLKFGPNLTAVYGDNGTGKSGFTRILKTACRARAPEEILGDVTNEISAPPLATIKYKIENEVDYREWAFGDPVDFISQISVFDTHSAAVYLKERTNVAFRPFGLDLFDKLVKACKRIQENLESEQRLLKINTLSDIQSRVPEDTKSAAFLKKLNMFTKTEEIKILATFSESEELRSAIVEKSLLDLEANDTEKLTRQLLVRRDRLKKLISHCQSVETGVSDSLIKQLLSMKMEEKQLARLSFQLRSEMVSEKLLNGVGHEAWMNLWEAARLYSEDDAYREIDFPALHQNAHCVLCMQPLDEEARLRLKRFESFVSSRVEADLRSAKAAYNLKCSAIRDMTVMTEIVAETLKDTKIDNESVSEKITQFLEANEKRRLEISKWINDTSDLSESFSPVFFASHNALTLQIQNEERVNNLLAKKADDVKKGLIKEAQEFRGRRVIADHERLIIDEIKALGKDAAFSRCIIETNTQIITKKSSAVTKAVVSEKLLASFQEELAALSFKHAQVELKESGGTEGTFYHKIVLKRSPTIALTKVMSEGEQRYLSIAAFFAELSTSENHSGIVFDDPVSSLDFKWRGSVAKRLVEESKIRQVVVFTHDIFFLLTLKQLGLELGVEVRDQHIRQVPLMGAGICSEDLPWVAMSVKKKIAHINLRFQQARKYFSGGKDSEYENEAYNIYGHLREAWERAVEELLVYKVVE